MNGQQLNTWRTSAGLTLRETAEYLGDITHTTLSRWEASNAELPDWVTAKLLGRTEIKLPLSELHQLLDIARAEDRDFAELLASVIADYVARHHSQDPKANAPTSVKAGAAPNIHAPAAGSSAGTSSTLPRPIAAEASAEYHIQRKRPK